MEIGVSIVRSGRVWRLKVAVIVTFDDVVTLQVYVPVVTHGELKTTGALPASSVPIRPYGPEKVVRNVHDPEAEPEEMRH